MKKVFFAMIAMLGMAVAAQSASAGGCPSPYGQDSGCKFGLGFFQKQPVPAFQAAPWYLYYPYNAYFMTPAPINGGAYYGPPSSGGPLMNPYFPPSNYQAGPYGR